MTDIIITISIRTQHSSTLNLNTQCKTPNIAKLSIKTCNIATLSITTPSMKTLVMTLFSKMTMSIITFSMTIFNTRTIKGLIIWSNVRIMEQHKLHRFFIQLGFTMKLIHLSPVQY